MGFWHTKKFKELQEEWDEKLKKSGFEDIEKNFEHSRTANVTKAETNLAYFNGLCEYLQVGKFRSDFERAVWYLYSEGKSGRQIAAGLKRGRKEITAILKYHSGILWKK